MMHTQVTPQGALIGGGRLTENRAKMDRVAFWALASLMVGCGDNATVAPRDGGAGDATPEVDARSGACGKLPLVPVPITAGVPVTGTTVGGASTTSVHGNQSYCQPGSGAGPEVVYAYTLDREADLDINAVSD